MKKDILIVGANGNMGKRYACILDNMSINYHGIDKSTSMTIPDTMKFDGCLIATPTHCHRADVRKYSEVSKNILCEKPICCDYEATYELLNWCKKAAVKLTMCDQYEYMPEIRDFSSLGEPTIYNYFKHGADGLGWDCINIIGKARNKILLGEDSPFWKCIINGVPLSLSNMDWAYMRMISHWIYLGLGNEQYIIDSHKKVQEYIYAKGTNLYTSKID